jgi:hypothetical protein
MILIKGIAAKYCRQVCLNLQWCKKLFMEDVYDENTYGAAAAF